MLSYFVLFTSKTFYGDTTFLELLFGFTGTLLVWHNLKDCILIKNKLWNRLIILHLWSFRLIYFLLIIYSALLLIPIPQPYLDSWSFLNIISSGFHLLTMICYSVYPKCCLCSIEDQGQRTKMTKTEKEKKQDQQWPWMLRHGMSLFK